MNLKTIASRHAYFFLTAFLFEIRVTWEYLLTQRIHTFLVGSSIALVFLVLPAPLEALLVWQEKFAERGKVVGSIFVIVLAGFTVIVFWKQHSRIWALLDASAALFLLLEAWKERVFPVRENREQERLAKAESLFADREAFEKSWQRRIKTAEAVLLLLCALLAVACWTASFKIFAIVPALLAVLFLIGFFAELAPMSDEKFETELAKAKARFARIEARRAESAARRARRAKLQEESGQRPKPSRTSADGLSPLVFWLVVIGVVALQSRSHLERPDLAFCAIPAWYLIRALYFLARQQNRPQGPDAPLRSGSPTCSP